MQTSPMVSDFLCLVEMRNVARRMSDCELNFQTIIFSYTNLSSFILGLLC